MRQLTTEKKTVKGTKSHKPRIIRVIPITDYGQHTRYYVDGLRPPVPAWMRHLDGWSMWGVVTLALIAAGAGAVVVLRLMNVWRN